MFHGSAGRRLEYVQHDRDGDCGAAGVRIFTSTIPGLYLPLVAHEARGVTGHSEQPPGTYLPNHSVWILQHSLSSYHAVVFAEPIMIYISLLLVARYSTSTLLDHEAS